MPPYNRNALKTRKRGLALLEKNFDIVHDGFIRLRVDRKTDLQIYSVHVWRNVVVLISDNYLVKVFQVNGTNTQIHSGLSLQAQWDDVLYSVLDAVYFSYLFISIYLFFIYTFYYFICFFVIFSFNKMILHQTFTASFHFLNCVSNNWTFNKTIQPS